AGTDCAPPSPRRPARRSPRAEGRRRRPPPEPFHANAWALFSSLDRAWVLRRGAWPLEDEYKMHCGESALLQRAQVGEHFVAVLRHGDLGVDLGDLARGIDDEGVALGERLAHELHERSVRFRDCG